eukprot:CAMPEP_0184645412 /NCGR_PEP_ID=MMETSP0308-20130426/1863_1 /TAXON_ID=38269 /ORGANISM="Gloeochaete witrockiana, Strain SAG 46.84" /LENGTH=197 /DNA_ID=CAMNT_0027074349 /DNA_START=45 /DNA_END=638 /DNA_ORIENTATION=+
MHDYEQVSSPAPQEADNSRSDTFQTSPQPSYAPAPAYGAPPMYGAPAPMYGAPMGYQQQPIYGGAPGAHGQNVIVVQQQGGLDMQMMHIISLVCCVISLFFTPLIELVPMIIYCVYRPDRHTSAATRGLLTADLIVTWVVFLIWTILNTFITVFSFGFLFWVFFFEIPYVFVLYFLHKARKNSTVVLVSSATHYTHA